MGLVIGAEFEGLCTRCLSGLRRACLDAGWTGKLSLCTKMYSLLCGLAVGSMLLAFVKFRSDAKRVANDDCPNLLYFALIQSFACWY